MDIPYLMAHPDELDQETLYDLRRLVGVHPTFHAARILFLQNLFLLHDPTFDQELRRAALLVPDRRVLCNITQFGGLQPMLDRARRQLHKEAEETPPVNEAPATIGAEADNAAPEAGRDLREAVNATPEAAQASAEAAHASAEAAQASAEAAPATTQRRSATGRPQKKYVNADTTSRLLDTFLDQTPAPLQRRKAKADPATDYMAYLLQQDEADGASVAAATPTDPQQQALQATTSDERLDELISGFISSYENGIHLPENPTEPEGIILEADEQPTLPPAPAPQPATDAVIAAQQPTTTTPAPVKAAEHDNDSEPTTLTETLAAIYIKQQKYDRAIEVISKQRADAPTNAAKTSNPYYADQVRFLQKLAIISRNKR